MATSFRRVLLCGVLLLSLAASATAGPFDLPRLPDVGDIVRDTLDLKIPDLSRILEEPPAVSTSFDDAVTAVPFLDDFEPVFTAPMSQLPFTGDGAFIVALPGTYELAARSYCLHAGTHGPGQGEGYLYAPLRGGLAGEIQTILDRSMAHQDIDQSKIQSLIWAIQSRARISELAPELREVADVLLTREQIHRLNGGALGMVPEELFDQAFVDVPEEVRMVLEAEARLRERLQQEVYDFEALEDVAVLAGDPDDEGGPVIPRGRWSYDPEGFFVRYMPHSYPHTTVQLYAPDSFAVQVDQTGRITSITTRQGARLSVQYADTAPIPCPGDDAVMAHTLAAIQMLGADGSSLELGASDDDLVLTGLPSGGGRFDGDAAALYTAAVETKQQVQELTTQVPSASSDPELMGNVIDLAHLCNGLEAMAADPDAPDITQWVNMARKAWASELHLLLTGAGESQFAQASDGSHDGVRLALLPWTHTPVLGALGPPPSTWLAPVGNPDRLPWFRPSGGAATPASRGRQRLGLSGGSYNLPDFVPDPRDDDDDGEPSGEDGKPTYNRARTSIKAIRRGKMAIQVLSSPRAGVAKGVGFGIPNYLFGKILDFNFDTWGRATQALGGDPPRTDYTEMALPEAIDLPVLSAEDAVSAEHAAALNELARALGDTLAVVRAAQICQDRLGGALAAGDNDWATRQAAALIDYKHQAGRGMMDISRHLRAVLQAVENAGIQDLVITVDAAEAYQGRLRTEGFDEEERQAADLLGIGDAELQQMLADRLAADPAEVAGSLMDDGRELADSLWWLGMSWSRLPGAEGHVAEPAP